MFRGKTVCKPKHYLASHIFSGEDIIITKRWRYTTIAMLTYEGPLQLDPMKPIKLADAQSWWSPFGPFPGKMVSAAT